MRDEDLAFSHIEDLAPLLEARKLSPVELVTAHLDRIAHMDPVLGAFIHVDEEGALAHARAAEAEIAAGGYRGPLHGISVAHKDILDVAGLPTTAGSRAVPEWVPAKDATTTARLRAAGAVCLGKLNLTEFAAGDLGPFGYARNPWNVQGFPGSSSAGSAVAASTGMTTFATGTDTGGSVRSPAAFCGIVGLRPTYGRVSRRGCVPLSWSLDTVGPMARSVGAVAHVLSAMAGADAGDPSTVARHVPDFAQSLEAGADGLRIGVPDSFFFDDLHPEVDACLSEALRTLESLGATLRPISLPACDYSSAAYCVIAYSEAFAVHHEGFRRNAHLYTRNLYYKAAAAGLLTAEERIHAEQLRQRITREFAEAMRGVDVIVAPTGRALATAPGQAPPVGSRTLRWPPEMSTLPRPASLVGCPALGLPAGFAADGTPIGMQLIGRPWEEATLLAAGCAYEQASEWGQRRPAPALEEYPARDEPASTVLSAGVPVEEGSITPGWVLDMARLLGHDHVTEEDAVHLSRVLSGVGDQLAAAREALALDDEPPTRPAGLPW